MSIPFTRLTWLAALSILAACGGGGSDGPQVISPTVSYSRPAVISPWEKIVLAPTFSGLYGNEPTCSLAASPPVGFTLDANCMLTIDGAIPGMNSISVNLTVKNYSGVRQILQSFNVTAPELRYNLQFTSVDSTLGDRDALNWRTPLTDLGGKPRIERYVPDVSDTFKYRAVGNLAAGLLLDENTGQLSGAAQTDVPVSSTIEVEITRGGRPLKSVTTVSVQFPRLFHPMMFVSTAETTKRSLPNPRNVFPGDVVTYGLHDEKEVADTCIQASKPTMKANEVLIDNVTGAVRPVSNAKGIYCIPVSMQVQRGSSTHISKSGAHFEIR